MLFYSNDYVTLPISNLSYFRQMNQLRRESGRSKEEDKTDSRKDKFGNVLKSTELLQQQQLDPHLQMY
jgi:hypothetical protein